MSATVSDPRRSRWIPWVFVGGMLLVVAVNAVLVVASVTTFTGVTQGQAYDRGRAYNKVLEEAARQDALGWRGAITADHRMLRVAVTDREGLPVAGRLDGVIRAPVEGVEIPLALLAAAPGRWQAALDLPRAGQWEARLTLTGAGGERLDLVQRLVIP